MANTLLQPEGHAALAAGAIAQPTCDGVVFDEVRDRDRALFFLTLGLFFATFLVFCFSPITNTSDSMYSMVLSESIYRQRSTYLDGYRFPESVPELQTSAPPIDDPQNPRDYQIGKLNGHIVYRYPNGSSILSVPFVAFFDAIGISP